MTGRRVWQRMNRYLLGRQEPNEPKQETAINPDIVKNDIELASLYTIFKRDSKKECREKLRRSFARNRVITSVTEKDFIPGADDGEDNLYRGQLILPRSEKQYVSSIVPNCCVICLDSYHPGDSVVWSCNSDCQHAMHEACVLKYLVRIQKKVGITPCCVCRCNFTDLEVEREERHLRRRGRGGRRTVRTQRNFDALTMPSWWISSSAAHR